MSKAHQLVNEQFNIVFLQKHLGLRDPKKNLVRVLRGDLKALIRVFVQRIV